MKENNDHNVLNICSWYNTSKFGHRDGFTNIEANRNANNFFTGSHSVN